MTERENAASKGGAVKQEKIVACLRKEAKENKVRAKKLMEEARAQGSYVEYIEIRARAIERRDFAIELDALADIYDWK